MHPGLIIIVAVVLIRVALAAYTRQQRTRNQEGGRS